MAGSGIFDDQSKVLYLAALNEALEKHAKFRQGMRFVDIDLSHGRLILQVAPEGITSRPEAMKAFQDMAQVLTISGDTLPYDIVE